MQTIETKYLHCTNARGARVKATSTAGQSVTIPYPHECSVSMVHWRAAEALRAELKWTGAMIAGHTKTGMVFVFANDAVFGVEQ